MKKEANFIYTILAICFVGMGLDYYLKLNYFLSPDNTIISNSETFIGRIFTAQNNLLGIVFRAAFILTFLISCYLFKKYSANSLKKKVTTKAKIVYWSILFPLTLLFVFVNKIPLIIINYPILLILVMIVCILIGKSFNVGNALTDNFYITSDNQPLYKKGGFVIPLEGNKFLNIPTPNAGISVIGSAGSGKTESIAYPIIEQMALGDFTSLTFDYKFPVLTDKVFNELQKKGSNQYTLWVINFMDLTRTHRTNIFHKDLLENITYASQFAQSLISNLMPESKKNPDFWIRSAQSLLTGAIWYVRKHHPNLCTLPHIIALVNNGDAFLLVKMLMTDHETNGFVTSINSAIERKADNQIAGVLSTLQTAFAVINTKNIFWALSGNDFILNVNDPNDPKHVIIGNDSQVPEALNPVISCMITVAMKKMNTENKKPSVLLLDEAAQIYIPDLPKYPAVCRSNKVSVITLAQSVSQYQDMYGEKPAQTIMDNLNTQIFGRTRSEQTAQYVSKLFGKEDKVSTSQNSSVNSSLSGGGNSVGRNESLQLKDLVRPQDILNAKTGEFYGLVMNATNTSFHGKVKRDNVDEKLRRIPAFSAKVTDAIVDSNYSKIRLEAASILDTFEAKYYA